MSVAALPGRSPLLGWGAFYLLIAASWLGLLLLGAGPAGILPQDSLAGFLQRCLTAPSDIGFVHLAAMWSLMSVAMMLPTALPALQRFAVLVQNGAFARRRFGAFLAAYLFVWLGFSLAAAAVQMILTDWQWLDADGRASIWLAVGLLGFAGLYQFSKAKHACLTRCRHPMTFFMANWRDGLAGAVSMGLKHGRDCLGCCWALMLLAFIGGTMNVAWMGFAMVLMTIEKLGNPGRYVTLPLGLTLVAAAGFTAGSALLAM